MTIFNLDGSTLPPPREGKAWCMFIYPGGRKELRQANPAFLCGVEWAILRLKRGEMARVSLEDAPTVLRRLKPQRRTP